MIELITRESCLYCNQAKSLLAEKDMVFKETQIGRDISREEVLQLYPGFKVLPIVVIDNQPIGSWAELLDYVFPPLEVRQDG